MRRNGDTVFWNTDSTEEQNTRLKRGPAGDYCTLAMSSSRSSAALMGPVRAGNHGRSSDSLYGLKPLNSPDLMVRSFAQVTSTPASFGEYDMFTLLP